ncbi:cell envelope biogenesis protein OmpA [Psychromonas sp. psych-6C06]|uniref:phosphate ABC transporter substrate-binding/OmpA family protein n=1 Tax=Psychromonas sp. psych-6C06 TaxID=2058089 RepID=UPI000C321A4D|nr:phosphate ABC transporter substrate-binding/OmpA family protein [Psychromonas sp. psych-6C06]PKF62627.1 cell envelope biogenesis protein OmpA [Psychromonas sp. psych-6C06]
MSAQETSNNRKLIINPEFKKQLLLLKSSANEELNIQISLDKMVSDKQYRLTVLTELDGLGSDALNELVTLLKHTPVYIKLASQEDPVENTPAPVAKKSPALLIFASLLLVVVVGLFVSWQNGYININAQHKDQPPLQVNKEAIQKAEPIATEPETVTIQTEPEPKADVVVAPIVTPVIAKKIITLPSVKREVALRLHGSNTVGEDLAPALLEAYLIEQGVEEMHWLQGDVAVERELQYIQNDKVYAIQLHAHGSSTGFKDLLADRADMSMSSRQIKAKEVEALKASKGDLSTSGHEYIIGLDGLAIIVNKNNPIERITSGVLAKIFSGEINNWKQLGGQNLAINLYARDENSGTWDTFNSLVLKANKKQLAKSSQRFESSSELSDSVAEDMAAIGFIGLPYVNNSKALAIAESQESAVIYPTRFTVSTEDYALSRRLYMYTPSSDNQMAQKFSQFVISASGQSVVEQVGLVSQNIKLEDAYTVKNAPQSYNNYAEVASRLSVNFRFESGSNEFDNKAKRDIKRLVDYLTEHRGRRIVLMGFSDSLGDPKMNISLSLVRASKLEKELNAYGLNVTAVEGFGEKLPIASNKSALGRSKNRRVEVWVF